MPPKTNIPSNKTKEKVKKKIIEDKTFGLKNKKGKKQQQYIKNVHQQVQGNKSYREQQAQIQKKKEMEAVKKEQSEMKELFKVVVEKPKLDPGVDPKSLFCPHFKHGLCKKGDKCIYSHDPSVVRKIEKRDLYTDTRQDESSANWTQSELEEVIRKKHNQQNNSNRTDIVCKYFLDAVEKEIYGWFWVCPNNGDNCQYRHALPSGYILKKDRPKTNDDTGPTITIEELIEDERYNLGGNLTPVNEETFKEWKRKLIEQKRLELSKDQQKKKTEILSGKIVSKISGKEIFIYDPNLADQDDDEITDKNDDIYTREFVDDQNVQFVDIKEENFVTNDKSVPDDRATFASCLNPKQREAMHFLSNKEFDKQINQPKNQSNDNSNNIEEPVYDEELLEKELEALDLTDL